MLIINKILDKTTNIIKWITGILLSIMLAITFIQVILRYVFNNPTMWAEEVTLTILLWFGYFAIAMGVGDDSHMSIEFFYQTLSKPMRKILDIIKQIIMIGFSTLMVYYGNQMVQNAQGKLLPASQISRIMIYLPLSIGGILMVLYSIAHLIRIFTSPKIEEES